MEDVIRIQLISDKLAAISKEDGIKAVLAIEEDLGDAKVVCKYKWSSFLYSKLPTSLLPKTEVNVEMITKSWSNPGRRKEVLVQ